MSGVQDTHEGHPHGGGGGIRVSGVQGTHEGHPYRGRAGLNAGGVQGTHEGHPYGGRAGPGVSGVQGTHEGHPYRGGVPCLPIPFLRALDYAQGEGNGVNDEQALLRGQPGDFAAVRG